MSGNAAQAEQHCAVNLALYRRRGGFWVLSESALQSVRRPDGMQVADSHIAWEHGALVLTINERTAPWGTAVRGVIRLRPQGPGFAPSALHADRPHWWQPVAPCARVSVQLEAPGAGVRWDGRGYHDANWGHEPLADGFRGWSWQRMWHAEGTLVQYVAQPRAGETRHLSRLYRPDGTQQRMAPLVPQPLTRTSWGLPRRAAGLATEAARMEDTPFYSRSRIAVHTGGEVLHGMHEQLDLDRFSSDWVQFLLRFRMRRHGGG